jgi:hypothetical protein
MSTPSNSMRPDFTGSSPIRHFSSVVLPMPLRPSTAVTAPVSATIDTSRSVWLPP